MNIIFCGAGKVGFSISKQLSAQGHSVTVIDQSSAVSYTHLRAHET